MSESVLEALCVLPSSVAVLLEKVARSLRPIAGTRRRYHHPRTRFQPTKFTACSQITRSCFRSAIVLPRDSLSFSILLSRLPLRRRRFSSGFLCSSGYREYKSKCCHFTSPWSVLCDCIQGIQAAVRGPNGGKKCILADASCRAGSTT